MNEGAEDGGVAVASKTGVLEAQPSGSAAPVGVDSGSQPQPIPSQPSIASKSEPEDTVYQVDEGAGAPR